MLINELFQAILAKTRSSDPLSKMFVEAGKRLAPTKNRKSCLHDFIHAVEDVSACRLGDLLYADARRPPHTSAKLLNDFLSKCASRMIGFLQTARSDPDLIKIASMEVRASSNSSSPNSASEVMGSGALTPALKRKRANSDPTADGIPSSVAAVVEQYMKNAAPEPPTATPPSQASPSKKAKGGISEQTSEKGSESDEPKPEYTSMNIGEDDVEGLSAARLTQMGGWIVMRGIKTWKCQDILKIFFQKKHSFKAKDGKDSHYTISFGMSEACGIVEGILEHAPSMHQKLFIKWCNTPTMKRLIRQCSEVVRLTEAGEANKIELNTNLDGLSG